MKWSLQQLNIAKREPFIFDEVCNLSNLNEQNADIRHVSPIQVKGKAVYSGSLLTFTFNIIGELTLPCSRTLADARLNINKRVTEHFFPANEFMDEQTSENEEIHLFEGNMIDLMPSIRERILLEIPIQIYADDDAERLAPLEGKGWEVVTEEQRKNRIDPRLASLAKFFDEK